MLAQTCPEERGFPSVPLSVNLGRRRTGHEPVHRPEQPRTTWQCPRYTVCISWSCVVSASPSYIQPRSICLTPSAQLCRGLSELRLGPGLLQAPAGPLHQSPAGGEHFVLVSPTLSDPLSHDRQPRHNSGARASPTGLMPLGAPPTFLASGGRK